MAASVLEIVELPNGDVVLQQAGGEGGALVTLRFSGTSRDFLGDSRLEVAKAMFKAGICTAVEKAGGRVELDFIGPDGDPQRILH